jgi:Zn finger protein HypA/HybF involved in hydrogenase expression
VRKLLLQDFIEKAKQVHGETYNYDLVDYVGNKIKVKIVCYKHGIFEQQPSNHTHGAGCLQCGLVVMGLSKSQTKDGFVEKAKQVHGETYNYDLVDYVGNKIKVKIVCSEHGIFSQRPNDHLSNYGCPSCGSTKITTEKFIKRANQIHANKYSYEKVKVILSKKKVTINCPEHGYFEQVVDYHLQGNGCPKCRESKGERFIRKVLIKAKVKFESQFIFSGCKYIRPLPFDFAIFHGNMLIGVIEYQGIQHYIPQAFGSGVLSANEQFELVKKRDTIKLDYCKEHNIPILQISYLEVENCKTPIIEFLAGLEGNS